MCILTTLDFIIFLLFFDASHKTNRQKNIKSGSHSCTYLQKKQLSNVLHNFLLLLFYFISFKEEKKMSDEL